MEQERESREIHLKFVTNAKIVRHEVLLLVLPLRQQGVCAQVLHKLHTTVEQITRTHSHTEKGDRERERERRGNEARQTATHVCRWRCKETAAATTMITCNKTK